MASEAENREAFRIQAAFCRALDAPLTAAVCDALAEALTAESRTGARVLGWAGQPIADALPLRLVGGLHALHRAGADYPLSRLFDGKVRDDSAAAALLRGTLARHDAALLPWLDGPPQTNEVGRSGALMTGLLHLAERFGSRFELLEIGSSAGLNLVMDRFRFDLGGVAAGPADAALSIRPAWRGSPPPSAPVTIVATRGVDILPLDLADEDAVRRLQAYVFVDAPERQARLERAIALVRAHGVTLDQGDAADWVDARLAEPQEPGVTRVLIHSVVWQYLPVETRSHIREAMIAAGARATRERPIGWVMMEPDRDLGRHEVRVRGWPGDRGMRMVALSHAHGTWVEGLAPPYPICE